MITFAGLRSRCSTPCSCAWVETREQVARDLRRALLDGERPPALQESEASVGPSSQLHRDVTAASPLRRGRSRGRARSPGDRAARSRVPRVRSEPRSPSSAARETFIATSRPSVEVARAIDLAHAAATQQRDDLVAIGEDRAGSHGASGRNSRASHDFRRLRPRRGREFTATGVNRLAGSCLECDERTIRASSSRGACAGDLRARVPPRSRASAERDEQRRREHAARAREQREQHAVEPARHHDVAEDTGCRDPRIGLCEHLVQRRRRPRDTRWSGWSPRRTSTSVTGTSPIAVPSGATIDSGGSCSGRAGSRRTASRRRPPR